jgi:isoleucyl-tRNA synthetase
VTLDLELDEELESEGRARDLVRQVQSKRREEGLEVTDCINLEVASPPDMSAAIEAHHQYIAEQTLAVSIVVSDRPSKELSIRVNKTPCP